MNIDSLHIALTKANTQIDNINACIKLGEHYSRSNQDSAFYYLHKSLDQSLDIDYYKGAVLSYKGIGNTFYYKGDYTESINILNKAEQLLPYIEKEKELQATIILNKGVTNYNLGKTYEAFESYQKVLELYREIGSKKGEANTLYNIGNIYSGLEMQKKARRNYLEAKAISESLNDSTTLTVSFINLGWLNYKEHKYEKAEGDYKKAYELADKQQQKSLILLANVNLGRMYVEQKKLKKAKEVLEINREIFKHYPHKDSEAYTSILLHYIEFQEAPNRSIIRDLEEIYEYSTKGEDDQLKLNCLFYLSEMESQAGNYTAAYNYLNDSNDLKDSLHHMLTFDKQIFLPLESGYNRLKQSEENAVKKQRLTAYLLWAGVALLLSFLSLVLYNNHKIRQTRLLLEKKNIELEKYIESNIKLQDFAHIASHDMRSPLLTISSYSALLSKDLYNKVSKEQQYFFNAIKDRANRLSVLTSDLLDYSKVNSQVLKISDLSLKTIIEEVKENLKFNITGHSSEIVLETPDFIIRGDYLKLKRVFQNLLDNAIKFKKADQSPKIRIEGFSDDIYYHVLIHDNGIGIKEVYQQKIFSPFMKLHSKDLYKGTGLGLSICENIIEKHGGKIIALKNKNGSTFSFTIDKNLPLV